MLGLNIRVYTLNHNIELETWIMLAVSTEYIHSTHIIHVYTRHVQMHIYLNMDIHECIHITCLYIFTYKYNIHRQEHALCLYTYARTVCTHTCICKPIKHMRTLLYSYFYACTRMYAYSRDLI